MFSYIEQRVVSFFLMIRLPQRSTLFPTRRSSDLFRRRLAGGIRGGRSDCRTPGGGRRAGVRQTDRPPRIDRKSTRLNSSHANISYAVFCLKKKKYIKD